MFTGKIGSKLKAIWAVGRSLILKTDFTEDSNDLLMPNLKIEYLKYIKTKNAVEKTAKTNENI